MGELLTRSEIIKRLAQAKTSKLRIGFTSGVFDLLHPGHVEYLSTARAQCDLLVVGVNSDSSVKTIKESYRPICAEQDRAQVVAALAAVDLVFVFAESNNNQNIELLRPDLYFKAGDYAVASLSSAPLVEKYGGRVVIVPFKTGRSTTSIIEKIVSTAPADLPRGSAQVALPRAPAVFLDRDGTLIEHVEYLFEVSKFKLLPGAMEQLLRLKLAGYRLVVVTNQPGIGTGYFTFEDFFRVNRELLKAASAAGVMLDRVYFCPHSPAEPCDCRKPGIGMIKRAERELNLDLAKSYMIGDTTIDIKAGNDAGCQSILVKTGLAGKDGNFKVAPAYTAMNLQEAAALILKTKPI
ncbi:MAG: HAD-IIIA family hydrolase [Oligoflexia bacterium]|nr:HAD-IIIA family hydrolase [Oligoflexia bacterium]